MRSHWIALALLVAGCKKAPAVSDQPAAGAGSGSTQTAGAAPGSAAAPAAPASPPGWKIESAPIALACGDKPLALPAPVAAAAPAAARTLAHATPLAVCRDQASVAAACTCLIGALGQWGAGLGLSPAGECAPQPQATPDAQLVEVRSQPADPAAAAGGEAFVLVVKRGATWSAVGVVEAAADVDLTATPKASHRATISRLEAHPVAAGTLYWIESQSELQEKSMGDLDHDGTAQGTACVVPSAADAPAFCYASVNLGSWRYALTVAKADGPDACAIQNVLTFAARLDAAGVALRVVHGKDSENIAGQYRL